MTARKMGPQSGRLVPCGRSKHHGHHPALESCPECPAPAETTYVPPEFPDWDQKSYEFDLDGFYWP